MNPCTLEEFLALPWSPRVRAGIDLALAAPGRPVLVALHVPGSPVRAMVYPTMPASLPGDTIAVYRKPAAKAPTAPQAPSRNPEPRDVYPAAGSRTAKALAMVDTGSTPTEAAQALGISPPTVFAALARRARADRCPCCGQVRRPTYPQAPA